MEQGNSQTIASFTGTLLKRQKAIDGNLVQLVFREGDENWLCVSTDPADAAWPVGEQYRIEGVFRQHGQRLYIQQPSIALVKKRRGLKLTFAIILIILALIGAAFALYLLLKPSPVGHTLGASTNTASESTAPPSSNTSSTTANTTTPAATPPAAAAPTTPKTTATPAKSTSPTSTQVKNPAVTAVPYCDAVVDTPFQTQTIFDGSQPEGTVVQQGIDGQTQTCYPGQGMAGNTTVIASEQDQIVTTQVSG